MAHIEQRMFATYDRRAEAERQRQDAEDLERFQRFQNLREPLYPDPVVEIDHKLRLAAWVTMLFIAVLTLGWLIPLGLDGLAAMIRWAAGVSFSG